MDPTHRIAKQPFRRALAAALALGVGALCTPVHALVLNHSTGFNISSEVRGSDPRLEFDALLPLFDPSLGTLRQVDLRYDFDLTLNVSVSNRTLSPTTVDLGANTLRVEGPRFFDRFAFSNLVAATSFDEMIDVPAGTPRTFGSITITLPGRGSAAIDVLSSFSRTSRPLQIRNIVLRPQGDVSPFVGVGERLFEFASFVGNPLALPMTGSILSGVSSSSSWRLDGSVDVTYDYLAAQAAPSSPVPAPPATILLLAGLAALRVVRRRPRESRPCAGAPKAWRLLKHQDAVAWTAQHADECFTGSR